MNKYVLGFAFTKKMEFVLLQSKLRPEWQKGYLNGIGGKIEANETPEQAMDRETFEETGLELEWQMKAVMKGINDDKIDFECYVFYAYDDNVVKCVQKEDEQLALYFPDRLSNKPIMNNLQFLIPFGICSDSNRTFMKLEYKEGITTKKHITNKKCGVYGEDMKAGNNTKCTVCWNDD